MKLTTRQKQGLRRIKKNGTEPLSPDLAKQLIAKGLIVRGHDYVRTEWNRPVATLWVCSLTPEGERIADQLITQESC